jgi:redox-regulated HSP33 family molecular chaperone
MSATTRVKCNCPHEVQDSLYGAGIRVANATLKQNEKQREVRCTVCKKIHNVNHSQVKK